MTARVLDLCSGIGAYALGVERAGMRVAAFCECADYPRRVLRHHWPDTPIYEDLRTLTVAQLRADGIAFDGVVAGFPCTDISEAKQGAAGLDGEHSSLWFEIERLLREIGEPLAFVILENSTRLRAKGLDRILGSLDALGYDAEWHCLTARAFNAPHERDRLWTVAYPHGHPPIWPAIARAQRPAWASEPDVPRVAHGIADQPHRRHAAGNCNPPVIVETIARALIESHA
jgi:DNA (cytosine-5)-methyltransferase 1